MWNTDISMPIVVGSILFKVTHNSSLSLSLSLSLTAISSEIRTNIYMCVSLSGLSSAPWLNRRLPGSIVLCSHIVDAACHIIIHSVTSSYIVSHHQSTVQ